MGKCGRKCHEAPQPNTLPYTSPIPLSTSLTPTHFPTHPIHFPIPLPTLPIPLPTAPLTSPYTPTHFPTHPMHSPHSFNYVAKLPCDDVIGTLINLTGLWKSPIKFFTTIGNLKSCFSVVNVNSRCMKVWQSYHVAKLLATV